MTETTHRMCKAEKLAAFLWDAGWIADEAETIADWTDLADRVGVTLPSEETQGVVVELLRLREELHVATDPEKVERARAGAVRLSGDLEGWIEATR